MKIEPIAPGETTPDESELTLDGQDLDDQEFQAEQRDYYENYIQPFLPEPYRNPWDHRADQ